MISQEDTSEARADTSGAGSDALDAVQAEVDRTEALPAGPAKSIQAIDKTSVHRICSGQVVLNLATAVKELVENSLDAGATCVEVRLKEYGSELIEVLDNGSGVEESNFQALTLKHHTSKLQDFSDLTTGNVDTFGFRGEALSSLCALSKLSITTRHESVRVGHRLDYDHDGKIRQQQLCARQKGTTVSLQDIFCTLPVRHKEFSRNVKKEFTKMVQVLSAYCVITRGVRISCTNLVGKGKKNIVVNTGGNDTMKENIINVFGPKQMQTVLEFTQILPPEDVCSEYNIKPPESEEQQVFKLIGYISSSEHGHGRSSTDRQFFFVNQRPCDFAKVSRLVNEVYHQFNRHQYPFVVLDVSLSKESVDVNVTPDKRQIFIQHEKLLLATVKASLLSMFEPRSRLVPATPAQSSHTTQSGLLNAMFSRGSPFKSPVKKHQSCPAIPERKSITSTLANLKRSFSSTFAREPAPSTTSADGVDCKQRRMDSFVVHPEHSSEIASSAPVAQEVPCKSPSNLPTVAQNNGVLAGGECDVASQPPSDADPSPSLDAAAESAATPSRNFSPPVRTQQDSNVRCEMTIEDSTLEAPDTDCAGRNAEVVTDSETSASPVVSYVEAGQVSPTEYECKSPPEENSSKEPLLTYTELDLPGNDMEKKVVTVPFHWNSLRQRILEKDRKGKVSEGFCRSFRAKINPEDNLSAENELKKEMSKDMFAQMEILGQFNLGFIIAKLGADLFIIDQHATDEKYNFEMLQRDTVIQSQKLICPQNLELTAVNESILIDNLSILEKNGFQFDISEEGVPTQRVKLISKPVSKNWEFGKEDIEELIFMLSDTPGVMCRPTRIRQMFASRACRKAVMIGTALSRREMRKLINHMGEIEQPWNCPHGRPTIRHLINMNMLPD